MLVTLATDLSLGTIKCCSVVFGATMTLLVINISLSTPDINKLRRLRVTTCRTVVRTRGVDNNWPVAALTARSEARYMLRIAISAYTSPAFDAPIDGVSVGILLCRLVLENKNGLAIRL